MSDRNVKPENVMEHERWHSRHHLHEDLPAHIQAEAAEHIAAGRMAFVARGSGRMHDPDGDAIEDGEWRVDAWPAAPLNGPEAFLQLSYPWVNDIAQSSTMDSLGGIAIDLASCERLAEAAAHAAAVLRAGQWVPRPPRLAEVTAERDKLRAALKRGNANMEEMERDLYLRLHVVEDERDALKRRVDELELVAAKSSAKGPCTCGADEWCPA